MQPTEHWLRDDLARCLDSSHDRSVATERLMCPALVVVGHVLAQRGQQVVLAHRDDVVGALPANAADHPLDVAVLPRRIAVVDVRPLDAALVDRELVTEGDVLKRELRAVFDCELQQVHK